MHSVGGRGAFSGINDYIKYSSTRKTKKGKIFVNKVLQIRQEGAISALGEMAFRANISEFSG